MSRPDAAQPKLDPAIIVIFGITGDLAQRYLLPALYHLIKQNLLDERTELVGVTRGTTTIDELFERVKDSITEAGETCDSDALAAMRERTSMFQMDLDNPDAYDELLQKLNGLEDHKGVCMNRLYYLSIPPAAYGPVIRLMGERGLNKSCQHDRAVSRLLVEKPFGFDLESAERLVGEIAGVFQEAQVFRIDHYMAKETVQNILTFRFQNPIFEALWNRQHISSIEISAKEKIGIEGRVTFYEPLGALRDFIQSHLLQILGIVAMDQPETMDSEHIHASRQALLESVQPVPADALKERTARGQYESYRQEVDKPDSITETYAAITVFIDNDRWREVPVRLLTGKALDKRDTAVHVTFEGTADAPSNHLRFRIQPDEGIELTLMTKKPGYTKTMEPTVMNFSYSQDFDEQSQPTAYERVLVDAVRGDHTLFATSQEVLASWRIVQPVLDAWAGHGDDLIIYKSGTADPEQAR